MDEGQSLTHGTIGRAIADQPRGEAWVIMDHDVRRTFGWRVMAAGLLPRVAGLGIELNEEALTYPVKDKVLNTPIGFDGSVQDR